VPVLDTGARGATTTFINRKVGDVMIAWENEALLAVKDSGPDKFLIVVPSLSIQAEPAVAVIERVARRKGTTEVANAYLRYLYSPEGQEIAARNFYRPSSKEVLAKYSSTFPKLNLVTVDEFFGGWTKAQKVHFASGGTFDKIFER
jgi:sulfate transport system substrate-binding protein